MRLQPSILKSESRSLKIVSVPITTKSSVQTLSTVLARSLRVKIFAGFTLMLFSQIVFS